jgi:hypothetical protein
MLRFASVLSIVMIFACGKDTPGSNNGSDAGPDYTADAPPLSGDKYSLTWGPVDVQPGEENTQCIWLRLNNDAEIDVHQIHNVLSTTSHHLIVYKDDMDTVEQTTPMPCQPFTGALNATGMIEPITITQKHDDEITLPEHVAYKFAPHQMVKLEMHYINSGDAASMAQATVDFFAADPSTIQYEAAVLFTGSPDIGDLDPNNQNMPKGIAPGASYTLHQFFTVPSYLDLSQSHIFAITGHEHHYGTGVQLQVAPSPSGPMTMVYNPMPFQWAEPATANFAQPFAIPVGGGLDITCSWTNTGTQTAKFGESANDEMCFAWMYYYPSQGSKVCIHTEQIGGASGYNACCPGDPACDLIGQHF